MNRFIGIGMCALAGAGVVWTRLAAAEPRNSEPRVMVHLALHPVSGPLRPGSMNATVTVRNDGPEPLVVQNAGNRAVITYLVQDEWGDPIQPICNEKIDYAPGSPQTIAPGASLTYQSPGLQFLTGKGLCRYAFRFNHPYRVVAVYRPQAEKGPGFTSGQMETSIPDIR